MQRATLLRVPIKVHQHSLRIRPQYARCLLVRHRHLGEPYPNYLQRRDEPLVAECPFEETVLLRFERRRHGKVLAGLGRPSPYDPTYAARVGFRSLAHVALAHDDLRRRRVARNTQYDREAKLCAVWQLCPPGGRATPGRRRARCKDRRDTVCRMVHFHLHLFSIISAG